MKARKKLKSGDVLKLKNGERVAIIGVHNRLYTVLRKNGEKRCVGFDDLAIVQISSPDKPSSKKSWY